MRTNHPRATFQPLRTAIAFLALAAACATGPLFGGIWGAHDPVPAATLVVPFFEVGAEADIPETTNITVFSKDDVIVHYQMWNIDGQRTIGLLGNVQIGADETWSQDLRSLLLSADPLDKGLLRDGDYYRGFMTIDVVTEETSSDPFEADYPFGTTNSLTGNIYYLRTSEGSANGLPMIHLEYTDPIGGGSSPLKGFYGDLDQREEIDDNARECSAFRVQTGGDCADSDQVIEAVRARVFHSAPLSGETRVILFLWTTSLPDQGGPSLICDSMPELGCATTYSWEQRREDGTVVDSGGNLFLPHVVNILETTGPNPGALQVFGIEDPDASMQTYAFSFNSAKPEGNPNINWDAIFEASVEP